MGLIGKKILVVATDGVEDREFFYPLYRLAEVGFKVLVASNKSSFSGKYGITFTSDITLDEVSPEQFDAIILPGGQSPAKLRKIPKVLEIVKNFAKAGKLIAAICHGPQILVTAGLVQAKTLTSWPQVSWEIKKAGGKWEDSEVVIDGNLITSQRPDDLPAFTKAVIAALA